MLGSWVSGGRPAFGENFNHGSWVCSGRPVFGQNCNHGSWVCSGRSAFGQNCKLGSCVCSENLRLGRTLDDDDKFMLYCHHPEHPRTHFASNNLDPRPKNSYHSFQTHYALDQGSSTRGPGRVFHKMHCVMNIEAWVTRPWVRKSRYYGEMLLSPIPCCDVTKPPYLLSGELCTSPLHSNRL